MLLDHAFMLHLPLFGNEAASDIGFHRTTSDYGYVSRKGTLSCIGSNNS